MSSPRPLGGLRKGKKESFWKGDVEAPNDKGGSESSAVPGRSGHSPAFLLRVTLRKVLSFFLSEEEMHLSHSGKIIVIINSAIIGSILSLVGISILIFLDHRDVIHLQTAHNFRSMAFQLMNDPETIATLEESSDLKFLTFDKYESMKKEIETKDNDFVEHLEKLTKKEEEKMKSMDADAMQKEYETLLKNPLLEWDKYCGTCAWQGRTSCDERAKYLQETYNLGEDVSKIGAMGAPSCVKQG